MKNTKSTLAMKLAHKLFSKANKASFSDCLKQAWLIVKGSVTSALLILKRSHKTTVDVCKHLITGATVVSVKIERKVWGFFWKVVDTYKTGNYQPWDVKVVSSYSIG